MATNQGFGSFRHLVVRFAGALSPAGPPTDDERWATASLLPGETELWQRMSGPDRRHAVGVARDTVELLGDERSPRPVLAAALLHDVGKVEAAIGTFARVGVTLAAMAMGRDRLVAWAEAAAPRARMSWRARTGMYLTHDRLGADLLRAAGSEPLTVAWAGEHHLPPERWSIERATGDALKAADGD